MPSNKEREEIWAAESDAHTLAESEVIKGDEKRYGKAKEAAERLAKEAQEKAEAMAKISNGLIGYDKSPDPPKKMSKDKE